MLTPEEVDVCDADPGHEVAATVAGPLRSLVEIWRGDRTWIDALRAESVTDHRTGADPAAASRPGSGPGNFAAVPRPDPELVA